MIFLLQNRLHLKMNAIMIQVMLIYSLIELAMMKTAPLYPKTMTDIKEEKQVEYWRRKIPEILVSPFNKSVWSLL